MVTSTKRVSVSFVFQASSTAVTFLQGSFHFIYGTREKNTNTHNGENRSSTSDKSMRSGFIVAKLEKNTIEL